MEMAEPREGRLLPSPDEEAVRGRVRCDRVERRQKWVGKPALLYEGAPITITITVTVTVTNTSTA